MNSDIDEVTGAGGAGVTFAMQLARLVAKAIDAALVSVVAVAATGVAAYGILGQEPPGSDDAGGMASLLLGSWLTAAVVGWAYEVVSVARKSKTLGKWIVGVQVTASDSSQAPALTQSVLRATRQLLLWIVVPLGLLSAWRLLLLERRQAWYDRSSGTRVSWAMATDSTRRRLWRWLAAGLVGWAERHPVVVLSVCVAAVFCLFAWPPSMQEEAAVRAIELLVTANIVGLGVFVAKSGLIVRYIRSVGSDGTAGPTLGESILGLGGLSFAGSSRAQATWRRSRCRRARCRRCGSARDSWSSWCWCPAWWPSPRCGSPNSRQKRRSTMRHGPRDHLSQPMISHSRGLVTRCNPTDLLISRMGCRYQPPSRVTVISAPVLVMTLTAMLRPGSGGVNG